MLFQANSVLVIRSSNPEENYKLYHAEIAEKIQDDGYLPKTSMDNLIEMIILSFDCEDNYGEYEENTGFGGYGNEFSLDECYKYIEESGGYDTFDYWGK